jgi:hypothetical protein
MKIFQNEINNQRCKTIGEYAENGKDDKNIIFKIHFFK